MKNTDHVTLRARRLNIYVDTYEEKWRLYSVELGISKVIMGKYGGKIYVG